MSSESDLPTRPSLLLRLRDTADNEAWTQFGLIYGPAIFSWCRQCGLQQADAEDIASELAIRLFPALKKFDYDPARGRFRDWLHTLVRHEISDFVKHRQHRMRGSGDSTVLKALESMPDKSETLVQSFEEADEREYMRDLLPIAEERVRPKVSKTTWIIYEERVKKGRPTREVAAELGMSEASVDVQCGRVQGYLKREIEKLRSEKPRDDGGGG